MPICTFSLSTLEFNNILLFYLSLLQLESSLSQAQANADQLSLAKSQLEADNVSLYSKLRFFQASGSGSNSSKSYGYSYNSPVKVRYLLNSMFSFSSFLCHSNLIPFI